MSTTTIIVDVESEPHTDDLSAAMLNRPAPERGAFLIAARIDRLIWGQMKAAGAWYLSREYLEDCDMFDAEPGWRYSIDALVVLLKHGYTLELRGETVTTEEQLRAMFTTEAKAAYHERVKHEAAQRDLRHKELLQAQQLEREQRGQQYAQWQEQHLAGLVSTTVAPPDGGFINSPGWKHVISFDQTTPGTWYDTGDQWYSKDVADGVTIWQRRYGSAVVYYAPRELVDTWILARDDGSVEFARWVVIYHNYRVYGSDVADRLVELKGFDHYLARATSEEWPIKARDHDGGREVDVIAHYGIPAIPVALRPYDYEESRRIQAALGYSPHDLDAPRGVGQAADGRWFSTTSTTNGGGWRLLTAEQCSTLGLPLEPPTPPPALPKAHPLPTADEIATTSQRFGQLFTS